MWNTMRSNDVWTISLVAMASVAMAVGRGRADRFQVELTAQDSLGIARASEPVSGGVPLPAGVFKSNHPFKLMGEDGNGKKNVPSFKYRIAYEIGDTWVFI